MSQPVRQSSTPSPFHFPSRPRPNRRRFAKSFYLWFAKNASGAKTHVSTSIASAAGCFADDEGCPSSGIATATAKRPVDTNRYRMKHPKRCDSFAALVLTIFYFNLPTCHSPEAFPKIISARVPLGLGGSQSRSLLRGRRGWNRLIHIVTEARVLHFVPGLIAPSHLDIRIRIELIVD